MTDRGWIPLVWPVPSSKVITQPFGANYQTYARMGWTIGHSGLDIRTRTGAFPSGIGTPIVASQGGVVRHAGAHYNANGSASGYGLAVILAHPDGTQTLYAHNSRVRVSVGETVMAGQRIADGGKSGNADGPHLHFELWRPPFTARGVWCRVDPTPWMEEIDFGGFGVRSLDGEPEGIRIEPDDHPPHDPYAPFIPDPYQP